MPESKDDKPANTPAQEAETPAAPGRPGEGPTFTDKPVLGEQTRSLRELVDDILRRIGERQKRD